MHRIASLVASALSLSLCVSDASAQCALDPLPLVPESLGGTVAIGQDVALGGDLALVSSAGEELSPFESDEPFSGAAWVLENGVVIDKIRGPFSATSKFGWTCELSGDQVLIGDPGNCVSDCLEVGPFGRVRVFDRSGDTWSESQVLASASPHDNDVFGAAMAVSGDLLVVGAYGDDLGDVGSVQGAAYVFERTAGTWELRATLASPEPADFRFFGRALDLEGTRLAVSSPEYKPTGFPGAVYVFDMGAGVTEWNHVDTLLPPSEPQHIDFGTSVSVSGDRIAVGSPRAHQTVEPLNWWNVEPGANASGAVVIYEESGGSWDVAARIAPPAATQFGDQGFGSEVVLADDRLFAARAHEGDVFEYEREAFGWILRDVHAPDDGSGADPFGAESEFGGSLAFEGGTLIVGAPGAFVSGEHGLGAGFRIDVDAADCSSRAAHGSPGVLALTTGGVHGLGFRLDAPDAPYFVLGTAGATAPGIPIGGLVVPLTFDAYTSLSINEANGAAFVSTLGVLDGEGRGSAAVAIPPALPPSLAGLALHHAVLAFEGGSQLVDVTEAVRLALLP